MDYRWRVVGMAAIIAIVSYIVRIVLNVPQFDPIIQIGLFVFFLCGGVQVKFKYAALLPTSAMSIYIVINLVVYSLLVATGVIHESAAAKSEGLDTYLIQISTILVIYLISYAMRRLRRGFSFIPRPPHNRAAKDRHSFAAMWPAIILSLVGISFSINAVYTMNFLVVVPLGFIMFTALYLLANRRDKVEHDRIYRSTNFRKDK
jgi:hypothetical protein